LKNITQTSLVRGGIPELSINDLESEKIFETAKQVWVPNRNGVFLNIGASFAEAMKCDYLVVGFDAEEAVTFPDNSKNFTKAVEKSLSFSTLNKVKIYAPLISMQKHEIVQKGLEEKAPLEWSWSCYYSTPRPCMKCESCVRRARAFEEAGVKDPLLLRLK
jgi:7-cyano-7-deazaguanine synthase